MMTSAVKVKVSHDGRVVIPKNLREWCDIREGGEVFLYGHDHRVIVSPVVLTEEKQMDLDRMQWSLDTDKRMALEMEACVEDGLLTDEDFTHGATDLH